MSQHCPTNITSQLKVSVVMSVYNGAQYVVQAVDSILAQTLDNFEFIIINDGSTDHTLDVLYSFTDRRITILNNKSNVGLAKSLNRGVTQARGAYIARQDADDISHPERLLKQASFLDWHPTTGVVGTATQWIDGDGNPFKIWPTGGDNAELQQLLMHTCPLIHGSTMYRRQCFEEVGGYNPTMRTGQDYDFWLRISEIWDLVCLPEVLYQYRWHQDMASVGRKEEQAYRAWIGRSCALRRRGDYVWLALGLRKPGVPARLRTMRRCQLAQRYIWWSAGARECSKPVALIFLLAAFLFDPTYLPLWVYLKEIIERKSKKLGKPRATINHGEV